MTDIDKLKESIEPCPVSEEFKDKCRRCIDALQAEQDKIDERCRVKRKIDTNTVAYER